MEMEDEPQINLVTHESHTHVADQSTPQKSTVLLPVPIKLEPNNPFDFTNFIHKEKEAKAKYGRHTPSNNSVSDSEEPEGLGMYISPTYENKYIKNVKQKMAQEKK